MPKDKSKPGSQRKPKAKARTRANVRFTAPDKGKRKGSPLASSVPGTARKKQRTTTTQSSTTGQSSTSAGSTSAGAAGATAGATLASTSATASVDQRTDGAPNPNAVADSDDEAPTTKRPQNPWGIQPKEVPKDAKPTQRAFQHFIRALCGLLRQDDVLPSAEDKLSHYDKHFDKVEDYRSHMRSLIDESRTAIKEAITLATTIRNNAEKISGPIANDIARIPAQHLSSAFTMVLKAGLKGFCPDIGGPVQSTYNQLHCHLAASSFQFLSSSFGLYALNVNNYYAQNYDLLCEMYDNFVYGTLAQNTRMERRRPGSLSKSQQNSVTYKARTRLSEARFKTAHTMKLRKPVQRMVYVKEAHSDDEHTKDGRSVRDKPGRNPTVTKFFMETLDASTEEYRKRNMKQGQREPDVRQRSNPLLPASDIGLILPPDVPIDFFTPDFYNSLTTKERARYATTGVAFPLAQYAFNPAHAHWKTMGKADFMKAYGNEVLAQYEVPSAAEIAELSDSDADDELDEDEEINLVDTDNEMDVDEQEVAGMVSSRT